MLKFLLTIASPILRMLGISALEDAMDSLRRQFDAIEASLAEIRARLEAVEKKNDAVFHGWELMHKAREQLPHAPAADPAPPGETLQQRARRVARHVANVEGNEDEDEPPESHV